MAGYWIVRGTAVRDQQAADEYVAQKQASHSENEPRPDVTDADRLLQVMAECINRQQGIQIVALDVPVDHLPRFTAGGRQRRQKI